MTRMFPFAAGFAIAAAVILLAPPERPAPAPQPVATAAAPWALHRAGPLLAQESPEMRDLHAGGRMAQLGAGPARGPH